MRPALPRVLILLGLVVAALHASDATPVLELRVMTCNLRYASTQQPNAWPDRRPLMAVLITREVIFMPYDSARSVWLAGRVLAGGRLGNSSPECRTELRMVSRHSLS